MDTRQPSFSTELPEMKGLSDEAVIQVAKEMAQATCIGAECLRIDTRDEALFILFAITQVARNNPIISVLEVMGEVPSVEELAALATV